VWVEKQLGAGQAWFPKTLLGQSVRYRGDLRAIGGSSAMTDDYLDRTAMGPLIAIGLREAMTR
jgi:hypothetical protein